MGSYTAAVVTDGVLLSTAMSSRQLLLVTALCASLVHSKILRSSIVRGQGFAAPPPGHTRNISPLQQQEAPRQQQAVSHFSQPRKPVKIISEFDRPGSFQPMKANYNKQKFEPTTEKSFVSGPPLGDDFFDRYTELIKRHQRNRRSVSSLSRACCQLTSLTAGSANTKIPKRPPSIRSRPPCLWTTPPSLSRTLDSIPMENGTLSRLRFQPRRSPPRRASPPAGGTCTGTRWRRRGPGAVSTMSRMSRLSSLFTIWPNT